MTEALDPQLQIEAAIPDPRQRHLVLQRLVQSINIAETFAPSAWAVTLKPRGFRLNAGQVETMMLSGSQLRLLIAAHFEDPALRGLPIYPTDYKSIGGLQAAFDGSIAEYERAAGLLDRLHEAYVRKALAKSDGRPRAGTPFRTFHSAELVTYARSIADGHTPEYFVLLWNPDSDKTRPDPFGDPDAVAREWRWSSGVTTAIASGDRVLLRKTGRRGEHGIVGAGTIVQEARRDDHAGPGTFVRVRWECIGSDVLITPNEASDVERVGARKPAAVGSMQPMVSACSIWP